MTIVQILTKDNIPVELVIVRHPNSCGMNWRNIITDALDALAPNGTLLISFYSEKEKNTLKNNLLLDSGSEFIWNEMVNPYAYNPFFISEKGSYSFDFFLVTINRKSDHYSTILENLPIDKTRKLEERSFEVVSAQKRFSVVDLWDRSLVTFPGYYDKYHKKLDVKDKTSHTCFKCGKFTSEYFRAFTIVGGKRSTISKVVFCPFHVPATKNDWELMLKDSPWANRRLKVYKYILVAHTIEKLDVSCSYF